MLLRSPRTRSTRLLVTLARDRLHGCESCWSRDAVSFADQTLADLKLDPRESMRLFRRLTCPSCENRISPSTYVVAASEQEVLERQENRKFDALYRRKLERFREFLIRYPTLGPQYGIGRQLIRAVSSAKSVTLDRQVWFHASRNVSHGGGRQPGRYHQPGQDAQYFAADKRTATMEVLRDFRCGPVVIKEVEIQDPITVIDLRCWHLLGEDRLGSSLLRYAVDRGYLSEPTSEVDTGKKEYRLPQFVSDAARRAGIRGILYESTRPSPHGSKTGSDCLVVFDPLVRIAVRSKANYEFSGPHIDPNFQPNINFMDQSLMEKVWRLTPVWGVVPINRLAPI